jgi:hypothetical protein
MKEYKDLKEHLDELYELTPIEFEHCATVVDDGLQVDVIEVAAISTSKLIAMIMLVFPKLEGDVKKASFCEKTMQWIYFKMLDFGKNESMDKAEKDLKMFGLKKAADVLKEYIDSLS